MSFQPSVQYKLSVTRPSSLKMYQKYAEKPICRTTLLYVVPQGKIEEGLVVVEMARDALTTSIHVAAGLNFPLQWKISLT